MITINSNTSALTAQNNLFGTQKALQGNMLQLSTGLRINSAADDAAGLQISNRMDTQINGLAVAQRNANDAISMAQTAEGAMQETSNILNRMRDLSLQSASDSNTDEDRAAMQEEVNELIAEIDRIADTTNFAGISLFEGDGEGGKKDFTFQVGSNAGETIGFSISDLSASALGKLEVVNPMNEPASSTATMNSENVSAVLEFVNDTSNMQGLAISVNGEKMGIPATGGYDDAEDLATAINKAINNVDLSTDLKVAAQGDELVFTSSENVVIDFGDVAEGVEIKVTDEGIPGIPGDSAHNSSVAGLNISTADDAQNAIKVLDLALAEIDLRTRPPRCRSKPSGLHYQQPVQHLRKHGRFQVPHSGRRLCNPDCSDDL